MDLNKGRNSLVFAFVSVYLLLTLITIANARSEGPAYMKNLTYGNNSEQQIGIQEPVEKVNYPIETEQKPNQLGKNESTSSTLSITDNCPPIEPKIVEESSPSYSTRIFVCREGRAFGLDWLIIVIYAFGLFILLAIILFSASISFCPTEQSDRDGDYQAMPVVTIVETSAEAEPATVTVGPKESTEVPKSMSQGALKSAQPQAAQKTSQ